MRRELGAREEHSSSWGSYPCKGPEVGSGFVGWRLVLLEWSKSERHEAEKRVGAMEVIWVRGEAWISPVYYRKPLEGFK